MHTCIHTYIHTYEHYDLNCIGFKSSSVSVVNWTQTPQSNRVDSRQKQEIFIVTKMSRQAFGSVRPASQSVITVGTTTKAKAAGECN